MQEDFVLGDSIWHKRTALQKEFKPDERTLWWQRPSLGCERKLQNWNLVQSKQVLEEGLIEGEAKGLRYMRKLAHPVRKILEKRNSPLPVLHREPKY